MTSDEASGFHAQASLSYFWESATRHMPGFLSGNFCLSLCFYPAQGAVTEGCMLTKHALPASQGHSCSSLFPLPQDPPWRPTCKQKANPGIKMVTSVPSPHRTMWLWICHFTSLELRSLLWNMEEEEEDFRVLWEAKLPGYVKSPWHGGWRVVSTQSTGAGLGEGAERTDPNGLIATSSVVLASVQGQSIYCTWIYSSV